MNSYTDTVRVGVAGATGYTGVELLRLLGRHPGVRIAAAMGSPGAAPRHVPSLKSLWDAPVDGLDIDALADAHRRGLPRAARARRRRSRAGARSRAASASSICRAPSGCATRSCASAGIRRRRSSRPSVVYGLTERNRDLLRDSTLVACAGCYPTAAILALQPLLAGRPASASRSSSTRSRASRAPARRRPSARTSASATAACRPTACSTTATPPRSSRSSASPVTFVPHLLPIDRGILETIYATLQPGVGRGGDRRGAARRLRRLAVRAADRRAICRRSSTSRTRTSATSAGSVNAGDAAARARRLHRQPREGGRRPGGAELQRRVRLRRKARAELTTLAEARRRAARGRGGDARGGGRRRGARGGGSRRRRPRRRPRDRRRPQGARQGAAASSTACASPTTTRSPRSSAVLAGRINTAFVAALGAAGVKAVGLTGADASLGLVDARAAAADDDRHDRGSRPGRRAARGRAGAAADRPDGARLRAGDRQRRRDARRRAAERQRRHARRAPRARRPARRG